MYRHSYEGYRGDSHLMRGCRKGLGSVGSRVIPYKKSELNMVEVECPLCTSTVDLGSNTTGTYECPYCHEDFEYESSLEDYKGGIKANTGVEKVTKPFAGYYRLGKLVDASDDETGGYSFLRTFFLFPILPLLLVIYVMAIVQIWIYNLGGHPSQMLTKVDHLYIHADGRVIVPLDQVAPFSPAPFKFNIEGKMQIQTTLYEGKWSSVSIIKGRKTYFALTGLEDSDSSKEEVYQFLRRFNLEECERKTYYQPS